jgi:hypothetical protein
MKKLILTTLVMLMLFSSCETVPCGYSKARFTQQFTQLVEKAGESDLKFSDEGWEKEDKKFEEFVMNCYAKFEQEMTFDEKLEFWQGSLSYLFSRYGAALILELGDPDTQNQIIKAVQEGAIAILGSIEEIILYIKEKILEGK